MAEDQIQHYLDAKTSSQLIAAAYASRNARKSSSQKSPRKLINFVTTDIDECAICDDDGLGLVRESRGEQLTLVEDAADDSNAFEGAGGKADGQIDELLHGNVSRPRKKEFLSQIASSERSEPHRKSARRMTMQSKTEKANKFEDRNEERRKTIHHEQRLTKDFHSSSSSVS